MRAVGYHGLFNSQTDVEDALPGAPGRPAEERPAESSPVVPSPGNEGFGIKSGDVLRMLFGHEQARAVPCYTVMWMQYN